MVCFPAGPEGGASGDGPGHGADRSRTTARPRRSSIRTAASSACARRARSSAWRMPSTSGTANDRADQPLRRRRRGRPRRSARLRRPHGPVRPRIGAEKLGGSVYELDPGDSVCPYHYENAEEEWLLVLTGTPTLRDPEGEHELARGRPRLLPRRPRRRPQGHEPLGRRRADPDALDIPKSAEKSRSASASTPTATRSASGRPAGASG